MPQSELCLSNGVLSMVRFDVLYLHSRAVMNSKLNADENYPGRLIGSWSTIYGEQDKAGIAP